MKAEKFSALMSVKFLGFIFLTMLIFSGKASAESSSLFFEGGKFDIDSGGTIERLISGMSGFPGKIRLKAGFHADGGIGEFAMLRLEIKKGDETVYSGSCYSIHAPSDKTPKCDLTINVSPAIADIPLHYILRVNNNSGRRINVFAIGKLGFDLLMPDFQSTFTPDCPASTNLDMAGSAFSLNKDASTTREMTGVSRKEGKIFIKAKWHTATLIPNFFVKLKIELLKPDGSLAESENFYSIHAPRDKSPNFRSTFSYDMTQNDARMTGNWKIKVTNDSNDKIEGFNIEKGSDGNPFVKAFKSTYKADYR